MCKTISVHTENMAKSSPPSLLHLIYSVVDVGVFSDIFVCHSLLPPYSHNSSEAPAYFQFVLGLERSGFGIKYTAVYCLNCRYISICCHHPHLYALSSHKIDVLSKPIHIGV